MARRPPRKVIYFEPVAPRLARDTVIESTFEVGRRFRCTMRVDCSELDPDAVIRPEPGEWHPRMPAQLDEEELADWRAGRAAVYQLAALTIGARIAVAEACSWKHRPRKGNPGGGTPGFLTLGDRNWGDIDRSRASNNIGRRPSRLNLAMRSGLRVRRRRAHFGCRLVFAQTFIDDLAQQIVFRPDKKFHLGDGARAEPNARGSKPAASETAAARRGHREWHLVGRKRLQPAP
jgi:hypothetical protein